jgi:hypothetical protein
VGLLACAAVNLGRFLSDAYIADWSKSNDLLTAVQKERKKQSVRIHPSPSGFCLLNVVLVRRCCVQVKQRDDVEVQRALEQVVELVGATPAAMAQSVERLIAELNSIADDAETDGDEASASALNGAAPASGTEAASNSLKREMFLRRLQIALTETSESILRQSKPTSASASTSTALTPAAAAAKEATDKALAVTQEIARLPANQQVCWVLDVFCDRLTEGSQHRRYRCIVFSWPFV